MITLVCFGEEDHRGKVSFSSHHIKNVHYQHELSLSMLILVTCLRQCAGFRTVKLLIPPLSILCSLEGSSYAEPTLKK